MYDLSRAQMELERGRNFRFGAKTGLRMALEDEKGLVGKAPKPRTKELLAQFPPSETSLDFRRVLPLTEAEIWEGALAIAEEHEDKKRNPETKITEWCDNFDDQKDEYPRSKAVERRLNVAKWDTLALKPLRSLSLTLGQSLTAVDVSETVICDSDMETLCARLDNLRCLRMVGCGHVTNVAMKHVALCCHRTLTRLNASRCVRLGSDACGWLAGTLGCLDRMGCTKLESLDVSQCPKLTDDALISLSASQCRRIKFLCLAQDPNITDVGICAIAKPGSALATSLQVLDIADCRRIGTPAFQALGGGSSSKKKKKTKMKGGCPNLRCLLAPRCSHRIRDAGIRALARGCPLLATLNVAGAKHLSEGVFGELVSRCRHLKTLNVTGCDDMTSNGMRALVEGLAPHVREATSFVGFLPVENYVTLALGREQHALEDFASRKIVSLFRIYRFRRIAVHRVEHERRQQKVLRIARAVGRFVARLREARRRRALSFVSAACVLQRTYHAYKGRSMAKDLAKMRDWYRSIERVVPCIQARYRGYLNRRDDDFGVQRGLWRRQFLRERQLQNEGALMVQRIMRVRLARRRAAVLHQIEYRRFDDYDIAAHNIQYVVRRALACRELRRRRQAKSRLDALWDDAARRITSFFKYLLSRNEARRLRLLAEWQLRLEERSALTMQRMTRGLMGRLEFRQRLVDHCRNCEAASAIQKIFRGSRILWWRHVKMNKVAAAVLRRQEQEVGKSTMNARQRRLDFVDQEAGRDSCSEDGGDSPDDAWHEQITAGGFTTFVNSVTGDVVEDDPRMTPADAELIGRRVRIYWPMMETWYDGSFTKFHVRKRKYRIDYDDGDHEWLNVDNANDRVQIFDFRDQWAMIEHAYRPVMEAQKQENLAKKTWAAKAKQLEEEAAAWEYLDGGQIIDQQQQPDDDGILFGGMSTERWLNTVTGQVRIKDVTSNFWCESRDEHGNFCFAHVETGDRVYRDPRFRDDEAPATLQAKAKCLDDARYGAYLATTLVDDFDDSEAPSDADPSELQCLETKRRDVLKRVSANKIAIRTLSTAVSNARSFFPDDAFHDHDELPYFAHILQRVLDILDLAETQSEDDRQFKRNLIANSKRSVALTCTNCHHDVPQSRSYCPFCGTKL